eukprot:19868-Heterococcus_DN1.PRE.1
MLSFGVPIALLKSTDTALQLKHDRASALKQQQQAGTATSTSSNSASNSSASSSAAAAAAAGGDPAAVAAAVAAAAAEAAEAELWKGLSLTWADLAALARWPDRSSFIQECQQQLAA